jgi:secondary thiamine-phosphate synthase enzyme
MRQFVDIISVYTRDRGLVEITRDVLDWLEPHGLQAGLLTLFVGTRRPDCSFRRTQQRMFAPISRLFSIASRRRRRGRYRHTEEGADDMPADIRTALTGVQLSIPIVQGQLALGAWQGIYLFEHWRAPRRREVALHLIGE